MAGRILPALTTRPLDAGGFGNESQLHSQEHYCRWRKPQGSQTALALRYRLMAERVDHGDVRVDFHGLAVE